MDVLYTESYTLPPICPRFQAIAKLTHVRHVSFDVRYMHVRVTKKS